MQSGILDYSLYYCTNTVAQLGLYSRCIIFFFIIVRFSDGNLMIHISNDYKKEIYQSL